MLFLLILIFTTLRVDAHPLSSDIFGHQTKIFVPLNEDDLVVDYVLEIPISILQRELKEYELSKKQATAIDFQKNKIEEIGSFFLLEIDDKRQEWSSVKLITDTPKRKNQMVVFELRLQSQIPDGAHIVNLTNQNYITEKSVFHKELWLKEPFLSLQVTDPETYGHWLMFDDLREIEFSYRTQATWSVKISKMLRQNALGHNEHMPIQEWNIFDQDIWTRMEERRLLWYEILVLCFLCGLVVLESPKKLEWFGIIPNIVLSYFIFPDEFAFWCALFISSVIMLFFQRWTILFIIPLFYATQLAFSLPITILFFTIKYTRKA